MIREDEAVSKATEFAVSLVQSVPPLIRVSHSSREKIALESGEYAVNGWYCVSFGRITQSGVCDLINIVVNDSNGDAELLIRLE